MICNIDGDIFPYQIGAVTQNFRSPKRVESMVDDQINIILEATEADEFEVFLSEQGNYRPYVASMKRYKGNRIGSEKPVWFGHIRRYLYECWGATSVSGCEADDALSIRQRSYLQEGVESCIASLDKDLNIVPGLHYVWACGKNRPEKPLYLVSTIGELWPKWGVTKLGKPTVKDLKGTGLKFFYSQMIMGDGADNIPGIPGKGATYAYNLINPLSTEAEMYSAVREAYYDAYQRKSKKWVCRGDFVAYKDWRGREQCRTIDNLIREQGILLWMQEELGQMWKAPV